MNFMALGDLHIPKNPPKKRIDNYEDTLFSKLESAYTLARNNCCSFVVAPGDIFDTSSLIPNLLRTYLFFKGWEKLGLQTIVVAGQHDLLYHNIIDKTNLGFLVGTGVLHLTGKIPLVVIDKDTGEQVRVYGAGWKEKIEDIELPDDKIKNIVLTHRMIVNEKLWDKQTNYTFSRGLLQNTKFDFIISGDNHQSFFSIVQDRILINCGSLMRKTIDQIEHIPCCAICDTWGMFRMENIKCEPASKVFNLTDIEETKKEKERKEKLENQFGEALENLEELDKIDVIKILRSAIDKSELSEGVRNVIESTIGRVGGGQITSASRSNEEEHRKEEPRANPKRRTITGSPQEPPKQFRSRRINGS